MLLDLLVDVAELGIPIRVLCALQGLGGGLQAEAVLSQQPADGGRRDDMALLGELLGKVPQRLRRPAQRRHRIPPLAWLDQPQQGRHQLRVFVLSPFAPTTRPPGATPWQWVLVRVQLQQALADGGLADPGHLGDCAHAPMPQQPGLGCQHKAPLPLVQVRQQQPKPHRQLHASILRDRHATSIESDRNRESDRNSSTLFPYSHLAFLTLTRCCFVPPVRR
jgi:hypothetical protein